MQKTVSILSLTLVLTLVLGLGVTATTPPGEMTPVTELTPVKPECSFTDVPAGAWYLDNLNTLVRAGGINGFEDGSFRPEDGLQLCQFVKLLMAILYPDSLSFWEDYHMDGQEVTWYSKYVGGASYVGLLDGVDDSKVALESPVNRYTMAVILCNAAELLGEALPDSDSIEYVIQDYPGIPEAYRTAVRRAYQAGILTGRDEMGSFWGTEGLTRAEACTAAVRLFELDARIQTNYEVWPVGDSFHVGVGLPWSWDGRFVSERSDHAGFTWIHYSCAASVNSGGRLFSVVLCDEPIDFPHSDDLGQVSVEFADHHVYIVYPTDVQFDPTDPVGVEEYIAMSQDVESDKISVRVIVR